VDCLLSGILVKYVGPTPKPKSLDGIATSQGTTGLIENCVVDGIPKASIYLAQGTNDLRVIGCEVKNATGPLKDAPETWGKVGISVTGADRTTINNRLSHHNGVAGLLIAVNGTIGANPPVSSTNI
jgi:hypothetical protein